MPIVVKLDTGAISAPEYTQEQKDRAWERVVQSWAEANKARLQALADEYASGPRGE